MSSDFLQIWEVFGYILSIEVKMEFWSRVDACIKQQNSSYRYLADETKLKESTISMMRSRDTEPRATEAAIIAAALGTSVEYLTTGKTGGMIPSSEFALLDKARRWKALIERLDSLDPGYAEKIVDLVMATPKGPLDMVAGDLPQAEIAE